MLEFSVLFGSHVVGHPEPCFQVLQLKDDIDSSLVRAGAGSAVRGDHEQRLTAAVRVAARKQREIQEVQANVSGVLLCLAAFFLGIPFLVGLRGSFL